MAPAAGDAAAEPSALERVAERYRAALGDDVWEFGIDGLDRLGVPVATATVMDDAGRLLANGVGYGATPQEARVSALGEALEDRGSQRVVPTLARRSASFEQLGNAAAVDPLALIVNAGTRDARRTERLWVQMRTVADDRPRLVPLEWVAHAPGDLPDGYVPLITPITNGLGAGDSHERALLHALLELLQRDGNAVAQRALDRRIAIDDGGAGDWLRARGVDVVVKVADTDRGLAVVHAVGSEPPEALADGLPGGPGAALAVTACGEAADPDPARAIRKALLEFCASRARKAFSHGTWDALRGAVPAAYLAHARRRPPGGEEPRALEAMRGWTRRSAGELRELIFDPVLAVAERRPIDTLPVLSRETSIPGRLRAVLGLLDAEGLQALWIDLSPPGGDVHVVRAVVPGLEVETMSYRRIGARNLDRLLSRDVSWVGYGAPPAGALEVPLADGRAAWLDPDGLDAAVGELYPLYREPSRHALALSGDPDVGAPRGAAS
jgi:YcaO-like protein with predicted kinase domain